MSDRPSLQEIADMPHSKGLAAVREFYDAHWGEPAPEVDPDNPLRTYRVSVSFTRTTTIDEFEVVTVDAVDEAEARDIAEDQIHERYDNADDFEFDVEVEE